MAEFFDKRRVVKKEGELKKRVNKVIVNTRKKKYQDAFDDDVKVTQESQQLGDEIKSLQDIREYKTNRKKIKRVVNSNSSSNDKREHSSGDNGFRPQLTK